MFEIDIDGVTYTVNGGHVLHLINKETNEAIDMPVNVFLLMDDDFQSSYYMKSYRDILIIHQIRYWSTDLIKF